MGLWSRFKKNVSRAWNTASDVLQGVRDVIRQGVRDLVETAFKILGITDETVYFISVFTTRLIQEKQDNTITKLIYNHAVNNINIAEQLLTINIIGANANIKKYLAYGINQYVYNIPTVTTYYHSIQANEVELVIEGQVALEAVTINKFYTKVTSITEWVNWYLQENENYTYYNSTIIAPDNFGYILISYTIDPVSGDYIVLFERTSTTITDVYSEVTTVINASDQTVTIKEYTIITLDSVAGSKVYSSGSDIQTVPLDGTSAGTVDTLLTTTTVDTTIVYDIGYMIPATDLITLEYVVTYTLDSASTKDIIWVYDATTGTYPTIVVPAEGGVDTASMLPIVPIRKNFIDVNIDKNTNEYKTSARILKLVTLDLDTYISNVNENEDIAKIADVFILFALNIYSTTTPTISALMDLFESLNVDPDITKAEYQAWNKESNSPVNLYKIEEQNYNLVVQYNYIDIQTITGTIGEVDVYTNTTIILPNSVLVEDIDSDTQEVISSYGDESRSIIVLQWQDTTTTYKEITVEGLTLYTGVFTKAGDVKIQIQELIDPTNPDNKTKVDGSIIPLAFSQLDGLSISKKEELIYEALVMTIYASDSQYLRYYETAKFYSFIGTALTIVAIVATIITLDGSGSWLTAAYTIAKSLLYQYLLTLTLTEILDHNISEAAKVAVAVIFAYLSYKNAKGTLDLKFAQDIMLAVNSVAQVISTFVSVETVNLQKEMDEYMLDAKEREQELQDAWDGLTDISTIDRMDIVRSATIAPYETPTNFYSRVIHQGNPGVLALDQIPRYVDTALKLPELP